MDGDEACCPGPVYYLGEGVVLERISGIPADAKLDGFFRNSITAEVTINRI